MEQRVKELRVKEKRGDQLIFLRFPDLPGAPGELCRRAALLMADSARARGESAVLRCRVEEAGGVLSVVFSGYSGKLADCLVRDLWLLEFRDGAFASARRLRALALDKKRRF